MRRSSRACGQYRPPKKRAASIASATVSRDTTTEAAEAADEIDVVDGIALEDSSSGSDDFFDARASCNSGASSGDDGFHSSWLISCTHRYILNSNFSLSILIDFECFGINVKSFVLTFCNWLVWLARFNQFSIVK